MVQLDELIKPTWSIEKSLNNAWSALNDDEKIIIKDRLDKIFHNELPFQLEHDKILYIHIFSLFAQLECIGLRGLIRSLEKLSGTALYQKMREQITDEVFHAVLFTKLAFQLSAPYALPLGHHKSIANFIAVLENEEDLATALTLVNLVGEGWIEEMFSAMKEKGIAPHIFATVLDDESRHLDEYELYREIGLPQKEYLIKTLEIFERELISTVFAQEQYMTTIVTLLGRDGALSLLDKINKKQHWMLDKIGMKPSKDWQFFMDSMPRLMQSVFHDVEKDKVIEHTSMRKVLFSTWNDPELPTESAVFSINVSPVCFFEKKYRPETITCLMLQALSKACFDNPETRIYMNNHKLYHPEDSYVALAVQLPGCGDQLGSIEFKNCHDMSVSELAQHIQHDMAIMAYCHKKTQQLQKEHPYLRDVVNKLTTSRYERVYLDPVFAKPAVSLSNIGHWGYEAAVSPLFPNETFKLTLTKIDRKQVWNKTTNQFEVQDVLPVGMSVDHRVFDGNIPMPYYMQAAFDQMFMEMAQSTPKSVSKPFAGLDAFIETSNDLLDKDLEFGVIYLFSLTHVWKNYGAYEDLAKQTRDLYYKKKPESFSV
ncbi:2-oxo acid dehydrogenase subunit E2 [uncultured Legionella sp.]|uniref:2-oxo acid dehydrogenase subunit E2 n=1 Tax=uncultured Legionella sp. TaxID=210934 RepID=UPI00260A5B6D|nr:2-oxo acid dehydrogenase subunit E2 [uncultured Legionella sp.]